MKTEAFLAGLFVWALVDGDYVEASVLALRWIVLFTVWALLATERRVEAA